MLHTGIPVYANRYGILTSLVASFLLLFTTSDDVLCLKFGGVWEMLWLFKVARWTHNRCTKLNILWDLNCKFGSVAYPGHHNKLTECYLWRFKLEILQSITLKPDIQMWTFLIWDFFFMLLFLSGKKSKPVEYTRPMYLQNWENYKVSWNFYLVFIVDF